MTIVLGIESSCDETGIGIVRLESDGTLTLLADEVASSVDQHARFGGVVPEVASRAHLEALVPSVTRAFTAAELELSDVDAIAVTCGPGLAGALLVGVSAAKAYAAALNVPLYGANHLPGHVAADTLEHGPLPSPTLALLVSGGHTQLLRVDDLATKNPGPAVPGRPAHRQGRAPRQPGRHPLPPWSDRPEGRAVRLLLLRSEDGRRSLGGDP